MKKRGLSGVVTNLILILLVLVAVAIVWGIVGEIIDKSSKEITITPLTEVLKIEQVKILESIMEVKVTRKSGKEEMDSLSFIINDGENSKTILVPINDFNVLETKRFYISSKNLGTIKEIIVTPMFGKQKGAEAKKTITSSVSEGTELTGLIGYWNFDDKTARDSSTKKNDGILMGGLNCTGDLGISNSGCTFGTAEQYVSISNVSDDVDPYRGTISAWAYPTQNVYNTYVVQGVGAEANRYYLQWHNGNFSVSRGSSASGVKLLTNAPLNEWHHLVLTWDYNENTHTMKGYLDGKLKGINTFTGAGEGGEFTIGKQTTNPEFQGSIDEVAPQFSAHAVS